MYIVIIIFSAAMFIVFLIKYMVNVDPQEPTNTYIEYLELPLDISPPSSPELLHEPFHSINLSTYWDHPIYD